MLRSSSFLRTALLWLAIGGLMLPSWAQDGRGTDQDRAREARVRGDALPLGSILAIVEREIGGRVIEVELEREDGALRYELEVLLPDGRVVELEIDARTGTLVKAEGTRLETVFKPRRPPGASKR